MGTWGGDSTAHNEMEDTDMAREARCRFIGCKRTDAESITAGFGGLVRFEAGAEGRYGFVCADHIHALGVEQSAPLGSIPKWYDDTRCIGALYIRTPSINDAAALAAMGWTKWHNDNGYNGYTMERDVYGLQGLDKCITRLHKDASIMYGAAGTEGTEWLHNGRRAYTRIAYAHLLNIQALGAPQLLAWDRFAAFDYMEAARKSGKNVGVVELTKAGSPHGMEESED